MPKGSDSVNAAVQAVVKAVRALPESREKKAVITALNQLAAALAGLFMTKKRPMSYWPIDF
jgi:hypothetical protein